MTTYERTARTHVDGSPMFSSAEDEANEREVAADLGRAWRCEVHAFGPLTALDFYALRDGRLAGVIELRCLRASTTTHESAYLNVRKWLALTLAQAGLGVPALWVVRFVDGIRWIRVGEVDASAVTMLRRRVVQVASDVEPAIAVPVNSMRSLP